jgi:hypothetical protein
MGGWQWGRCCWWVLVGWLGSVAKGVLVGWLGSRQTACITIGGNANCGGSGGRSIIPQRGWGSNPTGCPDGCSRRWGLGVHRMPTPGKSPVEWIRLRGAAPHVDKLTLTLTLTTGPDPCCPPAAYVSDERFSGGAGLCHDAAARYAAVVHPRSTAAAAVAAPRQ